MKRFLNSLFGFGSTLSGQSGRRPRKKPTRVLELEALETRLVPTVVFNPVFGSEQMRVNLMDGLQSPAVTLVFSGPSWNTTNEQPLLDAAQRIMSSGYLSKLTQYGSDGQAHFSDDKSWTSSATVPTLPPVSEGSGMADLQRYLQNEISDHPERQPGINDPQHVPIYVVVTDPSQASPFGPGDIGFNMGGFFLTQPSFNGIVPVPPTAESMNMIWVGTQDAGGNMVNQDQFTSVFAHELVERMSGSTWLDAPPLPRGAAGGHQIADNEANPGKAGSNYVYRLNDVLGGKGDLVQAYWSGEDNAFVVPDGNTVQLTVNPIWSQGNSTAAGNTSTGTLNLVVKGDQFGPDLNDHIRIDLSPSGGVRVEQVDITQPSASTVPGDDTFQFDPGVVQTVNIDTGNGQNTVQVAAVPAGVTVNIDSSGNSSDLVTIGDDGGSIQGIRGVVNVANNGGGVSQLQINASGDPAMDMTITNNAVTFAGGPFGFGTTINYEAALPSESLTGRPGVEVLEGVTKLTITDGGRFNHIHANSVPTFTDVQVNGAFSDVVDGAAAGRIDMQRVRAFPPVAVNHGYSTDMGVTLNVPADSGVLAGVTDAENDPLTIVTLPAADGGVPSNGWVNVAGDGSFQYIPNVGFYGWDRFSVRISDVDGLSNVETITIHVTLPRIILNPPYDRAVIYAGALAFAHSAEYYANFVTGAYQRYLGRSPDAAGLAGWVQGMQQGLTDEQVEACFIGSAEYIRDHGGPGAGWVKGMYHDLLGRDASAAEVDQWVQGLHAGLSTTYVAHGFAASAEREGQRVADDYRRYLGRDASAAEVAQWVNGFLHGVTNEDVIAGFVGSQEYYQKHGGDAGDWASSAYLDILGRAIDHASWQAWTGPFLKGT